MHEVFAALTTGNYKAFYCLHHELLLSNVDANGFDLKSIRLIPFIFNIFLRDLRYFLDGVT